MAFILRSSKYIYNFLGFARQGSLTRTRKKMLSLEYDNFLKFNEIRERTMTGIAPKPVVSNTFNIEKNMSYLHNALKSSAVDLYQVEQTFNVLKETGVMTPSQLILLLKSCGIAAFRESEDKRLKMAKSIWDAAKELGTELDIAHYNCLLSVFVEDNYAFSPEEILSDIKKAGLEPNRVTYKYLLKGFCQQGDIQGAGHILEKIKENNFSISEYDFCSLIQGHCEAGELEEAAKIFTVMSDRGIKPTLEPYIYLLCGYAKHGNIEKLEKLLDEINELNTRMTDTYLLNVVYTLIINNHGEYVDSILSRIKKCNDYDKTLMKVVHRLLHKHKDNEALKLFGVLSKTGYTQNYIQDQARSIVEHFVFNRSAPELGAICEKIQEEGWTGLAFNHGLKKTILKKDLDYCSTLMHYLKKNGFPVRTHYFWPLIVRFSDQGNKGILSVLKVMKSLSVTPCYITVKTFVKDNYKFSPDVDEDLDTLKKYGVKACYLSAVILNALLAQGDIGNAERLASSHGIFKPQKLTLSLLAKCFAKSSPHEEEKFINTLYYLAHDFFIYKSFINQDPSDCEEESELTGLSTFFDEAFRLLMLHCKEDVFMSFLQNASKKKVIISAETASLIRKNFTNSDVDALLKDFTSSKDFELNQDLLLKKSENATVVPKVLDPNGIINLTNQNDLRAEKVWEELGPKASLDDHLGMLLMYSKMKSFEKAFQVIERMKNFSENLEYVKKDESRQRKFRVSLHLLHKSGNVERMIESYEAGIQLGLLEEDQVTPVIRAILKSDEFDMMIDKYRFIFEKMKGIGTFLELMERLLPSGNAEGIEKVIETFVRVNGVNIAYTALFTAYVANGCPEKARKLLESESFKFQYNIFLFWFKKNFDASESTFEEAMEIIKNLGSVDRTPIYAHLLWKYQNSRDEEKVKMLWLQCQEDNITDPFFLEHLRHCIRVLETGTDDSKSSLSQHKGSPINTPWLEENELRKIQESLKENKYNSETFEKLMSGKLPSRIARKMLRILAAEGKGFELVLVVNKYRFGRFVPEIAAEMLEKENIDEFLDFVNANASLKKYNAVYNCFASQPDRILSLAKRDEHFFEKVLELSLRCYEDGKYEALLVFLIKICVQLSEKLHKAEEILSNDDSRIVSHFRNYALTNMLLGSTEEVDFYKNALDSERVKSVFSEALDHFYERVISFYNEKSDLESALSYLEKAKLDGVDSKLNKRLISSIKKNLEDKGSSFPYPELVQEAA